MVCGQSLAETFKCHSVVVAYQHGDTARLTTALGQINQNKSLSKKGRVKSTERDGHYVTALCK